MHDAAWHHPNRRPCVLPKVEVAVDAVAHALLDVSTYVVAMRVRRALLPRQRRAVSQCGGGHGILPREG